MQYASAALAVLKLRFDENLFTLGNSDRIEEGDGYTLYPTNNRFEVLCGIAAAKPRWWQNRCSKTPD